MTAPTEGWSAVRDRWRKAAWRAMDAVPPPNVATLRMAVSPLVVDVERVMDVELSDDERARITAVVARHLEWSIKSSAADAIADLLSVPDPEPFEGPAPGEWLRERDEPIRTRRTRKLYTGPAWNGMWHVGSGRIEYGDIRSQQVRAVALCGRRITLRDRPWYGDGSITTDAAVSESMPGVDACRKCARLDSSNS